MSAQGPSETPPEDAESSPAGAGRSAILGMTAPLVVSFLLRSAFQFVDAIFAADLDRMNGWGDASVAAIGLTLPFEFAMIACWVGTSNGLTSRLAAAMGAKDGASVDALVRAAKRITWFLCGLFVLVAIGAVLGAEWIAPAASDASAEGGLSRVARQFQVYAGVLLLGSAFTSFWSILPDSLVKAHQDTKSTMWAGLISSVANVVLNVLFVYGLHWGMFGIAFSTVLGRVAGLVYAQRRAAFHEARRRAQADPALDGASGFAPYRGPVGAILAIALPASITFLLMSFDSFAINEMMKRTSTPIESLAAWSIFDRILRFLAMPMIACGVAMLPLAARHWGRRDRAAIRLEMRTALVAAAGFCVVFVAPVALLLGEPLVRYLTNSEAAQSCAARGLRFMPTAVFALGPLFILRSAFEGMGMPRPGLVVSILRSFVLVVPLTFAGLRLGPSFGVAEMTGGYIGFNVGVALASLVMWLWFRAQLREG